ncbi:SmvA family efflux MFS transporter [Serratia marcescens]
MNQKWLILYVIILMYLPVSIDATVLHVAAPRLGVTLSATGEQLLWIIDIYSLVMAGLLLPMGALGDRIGFKRLAILGSSVFGLASLLAALAFSVTSLVAARAFLAVGAAMILPATLSALRHTFTEEKERNFALGIWSAVGTVGAAMGPLVGGFLMEYFYWGSVFLINLPIVLLVLIVTVFLMPNQPKKPEKTWKIRQALVLISAILLLVYAAKNGIRSNSIPYVTLVIAFIGASLLFLFVRYQLIVTTPMIDFRILNQREIAVGIVMALVAMITLVGFELLLTQELQLVLGKTPLEAGLFLLPLMIASGVSGPIAGRLVTIFGLRLVASLGIFLSAISFMILAYTDFSHQTILAWTGMALLGFSVEASMLASTAAIMTSVPKEKSGAAGALEGMAYELGAGIGVAIFGLLLSGTYVATIVLPAELPIDMIVQARASISETVQVVQKLDNDVGVQLLHASRVAFSSSHNLVLGIASSILLALAVIIWFILPKRLRSQIPHAS